MSKTATKYAMDILDIIEQDWGKYSDLYSDIEYCIVSWDDDEPQEMADSIKRVLEYYDISRENNVKIWRLVSRIKNAIPVIE